MFGGERKNRLSKVYARAETTAVDGGSCGANFRLHHLGGVKLVWSRSARLVGLGEFRFMPLVSGTYLSEAQARDVILVGEAWQ